MNLAIYSTKFMIAIPPIIGCGYALYVTDFEKLFSYFTFSSKEDTSIPKVDPDIVVEPTGTPDNVYKVNTVYNTDDVYLVTKLEKRSSTLPNKNLTVGGVNSYVCRDLYSGPVVHQDSNCQIYQINSYDNKKLAIDVDLLHKQLMPQRDKAQLVDGSYHIIKVFKHVYEQVLNNETTTLKIVDKDPKNNDYVDNSYGAFKVLFQLDKTQQTEIKSDLVLGSVGDIQVPLNTTLTGKYDFACKFIQPQGVEATPFGCSIYKKDLAITSNAIAADNWKPLAVDEESYSFLENNYYALKADGKHLDQKDWQNKVVQVYAKASEPVAQPQDSQTPVVSPVDLTLLAVDANKLMAFTFDQMLFGNKAPNKTENLFVPIFSKKRSFLVRKDASAEAEAKWLKDLNPLEESKNYRCKYSAKDSSNKQVNYDDDCLLLHFKEFDKAVFSSKEKIFSTTTRVTQDILSKNIYFRLDINKDLLYNLNYLVDGSNTVMVEIVPKVANITETNKDKNYGTYLITNEVTSNEILGQVTYAMVYKGTGDIAPFASGDKLKCKLPNQNIARTCIGLTAKDDEGFKPSSSGDGTLKKVINLTETVPLRTWNSSGEFRNKIFLLQLNVFDPKLGDEKYRDIFTAVHKDNKGLKNFSVNELKKYSNIEVFVETANGVRKNHPNKLIFEVFWFAGGEFGEDKQSFLL